MSNWKEERIADCIALQKEKKSLERQRAEDQEIKNAAILMKKAADKISELERLYTEKIDDIASDIDTLHDLFIDKWDIVDKTYECEAGSATIRTTKSLRISNKKELIATLFDLGKLPECIRTWNLSYLRKLKDVDLIGDGIASYDEHQNVVIKVARDEGPR
jgi:hypothetical protein